MEDYPLDLTPRRGRSRPKAEPEEDRYPLAAAADFLVRPGRSAAQRLSQLTYIVTEARSPIAGVLQLPERVGKTDPHYLRFDQIATLAVCFELMDIGVGKPALQAAIRWLDSPLDGDPQNKPTMAYLLDMVRNGHEPCFCLRFLRSDTTGVMTAVPYLYVDDEKDYFPELRYPEFKRFGETIIELDTVLLPLLRPEAN
jgi:hypothetical protein